MKKSSNFVFLTKLEDNNMKPEKGQAFCYCFLSRICNNIGPSKLLKWARKWSFTVEYYRKVSLVQMKRFIDTDFNSNSLDKYLEIELNVHTDVHIMSASICFVHFRLLQFMIEENVSLELKVESAVVLGSIAKGTEDNIRSLIDAGAISVLFKGILFSISLGTIEPPPLSGFLFFRKKKQN